MSNHLFLLLSFSLLLISCDKAEEKESFPDRLVDVEVHYTYSGGNEYAVKFEKDGLSYQYRSGVSPEKWWGKFPYNYLITKNGEHLVSWFEEGYGDYVTLLINFEQKTLYGSAIIKGKIVHFQTAEILKTKKS